MKRILLAFASLFAVACGQTDDDGSGNIAISQLPGTWRVTQQYQNLGDLAPYTQIHRAVDIGTQQTLWTDSIFFGATTFWFSGENPESSIYNSFILESEHCRRLNGRWEVNSTQDSLRVQSLIDTYMTEDTLINSHRYNFSGFVNFHWKIQSLAATQLVLVDGDHKLVLTKD